MKIAITESGLESFKKIETKSKFFVKQSLPYDTYIKGRLKLHVKYNEHNYMYIEKVFITSFNDSVEVYPKTLQDLNILYSFTKN